MESNNIAKEAALRTLLMMNMEKYRQLMRQQKTITSSPRALRVNRGNHYTVVKQGSRYSRYKTGYVPNSRMFSSSAKRSRLLTHQQHPVGPEQASGEVPTQALNTSCSASTESSEEPPCSPEVSVHVGEHFNEEESPSSDSNRCPNNVSISAKQLSTSLYENVSKHLMKTADTVFPSLAQADFRNLHQPLSRPKNAIEQLLSDAVVDPTAVRLRQLRQYFTSNQLPVNGKAIPQKTLEGIRENDSGSDSLQEQEVQVSQSDNNMPLNASSNQGDTDVESHRLESSQARTLEHTERLRSILGRLYRSVVKKVKTRRFKGDSDSAASATEAFSIHTTAIPDSYNPPRLVLSPFSTLLPDSPSRSAPIIACSPFSSLHFSALPLPTNNAVHSARRKLLPKPSVDSKIPYHLDMITFSPLSAASELQCNVHKVSHARFERNIEKGAKTMNGGSVPVAQYSAVDQGVCNMSQNSIILGNDPNLDSYLLPPNSCETYVSRVDGMSLLPRTHHAGFEEFEYQVMNSAVRSFNFSSSLQRQ